MRVDLHTHTTPASSCSQIDHESFVNGCIAAGLTVVALTNHGDTADNLALEPVLRSEGITLIHGVEISTLYGDFIIYSPDLEYLSRFKDIQGVPKPSDIPDTAALVWVHPAAGGGRSGSSFFTGLATTVGPLIDGVEVYNGNWAADRYVQVARDIASDHGIAATGGSDAHEARHIGRCATEIPGTVDSTADVVRAIRERTTSPLCQARPAGRFRRFFGS